MTILFIILIILACIVLSLIVLVQNPKGGGLAGNVAGFSNQFMGVKQTTDILEKGTWIFAGLIALLCITSTFFIAGGEQVQDNLEKVGVPVGNSQKGATTTTLPPAAPASTDTTRR
ncbi:MAG TPA: preprotein translocase subunit SecG [Flavisolibacter sp.]|jgi:preprotein translocase subunit SecG|nr:preprotein translocase subunit SecG [Flavisolibacter sp.]